MAPRLFSVRFLEFEAKTFQEIKKSELAGLVPPGGNLGYDIIATIEAEVKAFRDRLDIEQPELLKFLKQLDRHWDGLFRPPIRVTAPDGRDLVIHSQRTNNILEQFFRAINHPKRRCSDAELSAARFDAIFPDSLLVRNPNDTDYIQVILDGADTLARRFSRIDPALVRQSPREARNADSAFSKPRIAGKVLRQPSTPRRLAKSILEHCIERLTDELKSA